MPIARSAAARTAPAAPHARRVLAAMTPAGFLSVSTEAANNSRNSAAGSATEVTFSAIPTRSSSEREEGRADALDVVMGNPSIQRAGEFSAGSCTDQYVGRTRRSLGVCGTGSVGVDAISATSSAVPDRCPRCNYGTQREAPASAARSVEIHAQVSVARLRVASRTHKEPLRTTLRRRG